MLNGIIAGLIGDVTRCQNIINLHKPFIKINIFCNLKSAVYCHDSSIYDQSTLMIYQAI